MSIAAPGGPRFVRDAAWQHLLDQVSLGVRAPGTEGHAACARLFEDRLAEIAARSGAVGEPWRQSWQQEFRGEQITLTNVLVTIEGRRGASSGGPAPTTLLGSHYDARWQADNEDDPRLVAAPIPAANDGGSGTACLLELARAFGEEPPDGDVVLAFFDGEDLGGIDDLPYAVGSRWFVEHGLDWGDGIADRLAVDRVIALDMIGGRGAKLNIEGNSLVHSEEARALFQRLFRTGREAGRAAFFGGKERWIYSDHGPFLDAGMPALCLIDIDYPQWHTQRDLPAACAPEPIAEVGQTLLEVLRQS
ncbi:MAG: M28 family peptidase [Deltaproteobacteria bacterium]|nr:M28 family peptidase [Deltaproteobacteria bacterium]